MIGGEKPVGTASDVSRLLLALCVRFSRLMTSASEASQNNTDSQKTVHEINNPCARSQVQCVNEKLSNLFDLARNGRKKCFVVFTPLYQRIATGSPSEYASLY